jgi:hypothetical protein
LALLADVPMFALNGVQTCTIALTP